MNRKRWLVMGMVLVLGGLLVACAAPTPQTMGSPQQTVTDFYAWYTAQEGSPLGSRAYQESEYLSADFIAELDALVDSFGEHGGGAADPFICAQDAPPEVTVVKAEGTPELTRVTVEAWNPLYVDVSLIDWEWKIVDIHCSLPE